VVRKHAAFAPASQKRLGSRLRSPLPSVKEPCPLSLSHGFLTTLSSLHNAKPACFRNTQPDLCSKFYHRNRDAFVKLRSRREERMEMALKIQWGARLFSKTFFNEWVDDAFSKTFCYICLKLKGLFEKEKK